MTDSSSTSHPGQAAAVNLLWTGGWDSTFHLLRLLLRHRARVVPYYLSDPTRPSTGTELRTMDRIAGHLRATHPHVDALLQPLRVHRVEEVAADPEIAAALHEIRRRSYIGSQYAWLPAFCRQQGIADMELGVHVDDKVQALVRPCAEAFEHAAGYRSVRVDPRYAGTPEAILFGCFSFPLFHIDKRGMAAEAGAEGWDEVMDMTWFCHRPVRGRPCGLCAPCVYTIEEGLPHRVPAGRRALSFLYRRIALPLKDPLRQLRMARSAGPSAR